MTVTCERGQDVGTGDGQMETFWVPFWILSGSWLVSHINSDVISELQHEKRS